jgi:hypothetical protein
MTKYNYARIKTLAEELDRPATTLIALSPNHDPFYILPGRRAQAEWFGALWHKHFSERTDIHLREIHYVLISQKVPVKTLSGISEHCWDNLLKASRDARLLGLAPIECFEDRRNDPPVVFLPEPPDEPASVSIDAPLIDDATREPLEQLDAEPPGLLEEPIGEVYLELSQPDPIDMPDPIEPPDPPNPSDEVPLPPELTLSVHKPAQPCFHLELWAEKTSVNDTMLSVGREYKVNILTGTGFESLTQCNRLIDRAVRSGLPVRILYISDFDPCGRNMPVAVARTIEFLLQQRDLDLGIQIIPIALTHAQCVEYQLPRTPLKKEDTSRAAFEAQYGEGGTEIDALQALHPGVLRQILVEAIERYHDPGFADRMFEAEQDIEARLTEVTDDVVAAHDLDALGGSYQELVEHRNDAAEALGIARTDALNAELAELAGDQVGGMNTAIHGIRGRIAAINAEFEALFGDRVAAVNTDLARIAEQAAALDTEFRARAKAGITALNAEIVALEEHYGAAIQEAAARFNAEQQAVAEELEAEAASVLDEAEWPAPEEDPDVEPPLFDSRRDYVEQIGFYKEYQHKPTERQKRRAYGSRPGCTRKKAVQP